MKDIIVSIVFSILIVSIVGICVSLIYTNMSLNKLNIAYQQKYNEVKNDLEKAKNRLEKVEEEWKEIHSINKKITIVAPEINTLSKKKLSYYIHYYGKKYCENKIIQDIMISLPYVESTYGKYAIGKAGEVGYYQIHPIHITKSDMKSGNIFDEDFQVRNAYLILNENFERYKKVKLAINGYNGWASFENPYYDKVFVPLERIKNI